MAAPDSVVCLSDKFGMVEGLWSPHIVAEFNGFHVKLARVQGEFSWHAHDDTDEVFLIRRGSLRIEMQGRGAALLEAGDLFVVPAGVVHRPVAEQECHLVLIEPADTPNTGDTATAAAEPWI